MNSNVWEVGMFGMRSKKRQAVSVILEEAGCAIELF